jgi:hypothetical protein
MTGRLRLQLKRKERRDAGDEGEDQAEAAADPGQAPAAPEEGPHGLEEVSPRGLRAPGHHDSPKLAGRCHIIRTHTPPFFDPQKQLTCAFSAYLRPRVLATP